ncbi:hypothetical protein BCR34DRAFT_596665 [Clohesyomyces aquaticus]|uniref:Uncharacterized protein n=1 Tax=Clohesyomyces aquaticus TaxID=1231657 RepID=A0A1Y2A5L0_9PLEO|nr:hypothetical protein BCR34DRAFT_596665 [Clohesyomyces aquaticus]
MAIPFELEEWAKQYYVDRYRRTGSTWDKEQGLCVYAVPVATVDIDAKIGDEDEDEDEDVVQNIEHSSEFEAISYYEDAEIKSQDMSESTVGDDVSGSVNGDGDCTDGPYSSSAYSSPNHGPNIPNFSLSLGFNAQSFSAGTTSQTQHAPRDTSAPSTSHASSNADLDPYSALFSDVPSDVLLVVFQAGNFARDYRLQNPSRGVRQQQPERRDSGAYTDTSAHAFETEEAPERGEDVEVREEADPAPRARAHHEIGIENNGAEQGRAASPPDPQPQPQPHSHPHPHRDPVPENSPLAQRPHSNPNSPSVRVGQIMTFHVPEEVAPRAWDS